MRNEKMKKNTQAKTVRLRVSIGTLYYGHIYSRLVNPRTTLRTSSISGIFSEEIRPIFFISLLLSIALMSPTNIAESFLSPVSAFFRGIFVDIAGESWEVKGKITTVEEYSFKRLEEIINTGLVFRSSLPKPGFKSPTHICPRKIFVGLLFTILPLGDRQKVLPPTLC